jgi:predicted transcriptional regulator of viral defense system
MVVTTVAVLRQVPTQSFDGIDVRFVKLAHQKFFGFATYNLNGREIVVSTPAKTVVDCVDRPDLVCGPPEVARVVHGASANVDPSELLDAALRMQSRSLWQRLGFLADLVAWRWPDNVRRELRAAIPKSQRSVFGAAERRQHDIGYISDWGLLVNVPEQVLLSDVPSKPTALHP